MSLDVESSLSATTRRLTDLRDFQLPRLQRCVGPIGLYRELAEEMRVDLETVRRSLEMSRELAESDLEGWRYTDRIDGLAKDLQELRMAYREALVDSKRNIDTNARSRRHELLINKSQDGTLEDPSLSNLKSSVRTGTTEDDALQTKTNEVTDALRRTTTLMQTELERSVLSVQMLDESTKTLNLTQALYDNYTSLLNTSSHLVKAIEKADWYDRLLIFAAFAFFLLIVGWVIKRRVLDKVVGGVGWYVGGSWKLILMGLGRGGGKGVGVGVGSVKEAGKVVKSKVGVKGVEEVVQSAGTAVSAASAVAGTAVTVASAAISAVTSMGSVGSSIQDKSNTRNANRVEQAQAASMLLDQVVPLEVPDPSPSRSQGVTIKDEL